MNPIRFLLMFVISFSIYAPLQANDFEAALSSETAQFTIRSDSALIGWGGADLDFSLFYNEDNDVVAQLALLKSRQASSQNPLTLGIGIKVYGGMLERSDENIFALGLGAEIRYTIANKMPLSFYLRGFTAPEITSFSDTSGIDDYTVGVQFEILPQTVAFIGVRHLEVDSKNLSGYKLDDDQHHIGIRLTF